MAAAFYPLMLFDSREALRVELSRMKAAFASRLVLLDQSCAVDPSLSLADHLVWLQRYAKPKRCLNTHAIEFIRQTLFPAIPDFTKCFPDSHYNKSVLNALLAVCRCGFACVLVEPTRQLTEQQSSDWLKVVSLLQPLSDSVFYFDLISRKPFYPDFV